MQQRRPVRRASLSKFLDKAGIIEFACALSASRSGVAVHGAQPAC